MSLPELTIKLSHKVPMNDRPTVTCSSDAYNILRPLYPDEQIEHVEFCFAMFCNSKGKVIGYHMISKGGIDATHIDIRVIFQFALLANATSILVSHNHPSGNLQPSRSDDAFTKKLSDACKIMNFTLVDHIIVSRDGYYSFADDFKMK